jgi:hypothetical protein
VLLLVCRSASGASASSNSTATCPTSAAITAAAGTAYPAAKASSNSGTVLCNYSDSKTGANLVLMFSPAASGTSASTLKMVMDMQAKAQNTTAAPVSGLGAAAYMFTLADARTNASHVATTMLMILDGSQLINITAQATFAQVQAVARYVLAH